MVQVCTLIVTIAAPLGSKFAPLLIGVHIWTPNIHVCNHRSLSVPRKGANLHPKKCKDYRCRFALWGMHTDMRVQTSTLTGANLSWLQLYGSKFAFGVQDCALKGALIVIVWGCKRAPLFPGVYHPVSGGNSTTNIAIQCIPEKTEPWNNGMLRASFEVHVIMTIIIYISCGMINMLSNDTLLKLLQSCFTEQHCFQNWMSKSICATLR